jgi:hypothetical protein
MDGLPFAASAARWCVAAAFRSFQNADFAANLGIAIGGWSAAVGSLTA